MSTTTFTGGSGNPALNARTFARIVAREVDSPRMTLEGTAVKTGVLTILVAATAVYAWLQLLFGGVTYVWPLMIVGLVGGLILSIVTIFKKNWAPVTAPLYAAFEGLALGVISVIMDAYYPGIVFQAILLTFSVLAAMLLAYGTHLIKPTENLKLGIFAATAGVFVFYMFAFVMQIFTGHAPLINDAGPVGIGISLLIVGIAAFNLVIDFDFIEQGVEHGAPKFMEWYAAFGLMVTLIWLYVEILRLLGKTRRS